MKKLFLAAVVALCLFATRAPANGNCLGAGAFVTGVNQQIVTTQQAFVPMQAFMQSPVYSVPVNAAFAGPGFGFGLGVGFAPRLGFGFGRSAFLGGRGNFIGRGGLAVRGRSTLAIRGRGFGR